VNEKIGIAHSVIPFFFQIPNKKSHMHLLGFASSLSAIAVKFQKAVWQVFGG